ncbi:hypothetical protein EGH24_07005 [Halonotius terrestris]|uniref:Uncharacterized protein n=1 Tax=Halonotius terrestris TaxID=2487750 RepID=A0A8J8P8E7_9EURY|nr:hypothetical protein [Halonotius terrestris]TQQ80899.1 hypothetical protein EGH24_07005 [Halonotius terrestris]
MRRIMRNALLLTGFVVVALLAVGAVPSYLGSGDAYYLEATPTDEAGAAVNATGISERRFPYLTTALTADDGRSEGYQRALGGYKTLFAHSPFDEFDALQRLDREAVRDDGDRVLVTYDGDRYSVAIVSDAGGGEQ